MAELEIVHGSEVVVTGMSLNIIDSAACLMEAGVDRLDESIELGGWCPDEAIPDEVRYAGLE